MTKAILMTAVLLGAGIAGAQTFEPSYQSRAGAPDLVQLDVGYTTQISHDSFGAAFTSLTYGRLYGNVSVSERLNTTALGSVYGDLTLGNSWNDLGRVYVDGQVSLNRGNLNVYTGLRQGLIGNHDTTFRAGVKVGW
jgi:hypothetical protein